jgi:hypothetical protein
MYVVVYWNQSGVHGELDLIEDIVHPNREEAIQRRDELQPSFRKKLEIAEVLKD